MQVSCYILFFSFLYIETIDLPRPAIVNESRRGKGDWNLERSTYKVHRKDVITRMLESERDVDRMFGAKRVGEGKARQYIHAVTKLLDDPNQYVRGWAAWALGEIGDRRSIGPLIRAMVKYSQIARSDNGVQESKCLTDFYLALEKLSGKQFGLDVSKWQEWWISENWEAMLGR
jgi:hypothetical protein